SATTSFCLDKSTKNVTFCCFFPNGFLMHSIVSIKCRKSNRYSILSAKYTKKRAHAHAKRCKGRGPPHAQKGGRPARQLPDGAVPPLGRSFDKIRRRLRRHKQSPLCLAERRCALFQEPVDDLFLGLVLGQAQRHQFDELLARDLLHISLHEVRGFH